jgi:transposase
MSIPGIAPLAATALLAAIGDGRQFRRACDLAAWLGLVPREYSTGGKTTLPGISKRGNRAIITKPGALYERQDPAVA